MSKEEKSIQQLVSEPIKLVIGQKVKSAALEGDITWREATEDIIKIVEASRAADKKRIEELEEVLKELADKSSMLLAFATANLPDDRLESYLMNYACDTEVATARYILTSVTR
jgi:hypothetical protein